jgi:hypothetical protein
MKPGIIAWFVLFAVMACMTCVTQEGGSEEPVITGILIDKDGKPVDGATVYAFDRQHVPWPQDTGSARAGRAVAWGYTNADGRYTLNLLLPGITTLFAETPDGRVVFVDSILVSGNEVVEVDAATLKAPGTVAGTFILAGETDSIKPNVSIYVPGTPVLEISDSSRDYSIGGMPEGTYALAFMPDRQEFLGMRKRITVTSNDTTMLDTFILYSDYISGVPHLYAGPDTLVPVGGTGNLQASISDTFGTAIFYEWKCLDENDTADAAFVPSAKGDFSKAFDSAQYQRYICICRVTDNDSNTVYDTVVISVSDSSRASALAMCIDRSPVYGWDNAARACLAIAADSLTDSVIDSSSLYTGKGVSQLIKQHFERIVLTSAIDSSPDSVMDSIVTPAPDSSADSAADSAAGSATDSVTDASVGALSYNTLGDTLEQSVDIYAMDFATPAEARAMYTYATDSLLSDSTSCSLAGYPTSVAILTYSTSDTLFSEPADSADTVSVTAVYAVHTLHAVLNKFYYRWNFSGLRTAAEGLSLAESVMREYEQRLVQ